MSKLDITKNFVRENMKITIDFISSPMLIWKMWPCKLQTIIIDMNWQKIRTIFDAEDIVHQSHRFQTRKNALIVLIYRCQLLRVIILGSKLEAAVKAGSKTLVTFQLQSQSCPRRAIKTQLAQSDSWNKVDMLKFPTPPKKEEIKTQLWQNQIFKTKLAYGHFLFPEITF